jgi:uridine phosphorylase
MPIRESELIVKNGRIYHLGLGKDDLADIIITVGDPQRVKAVSQHFDRIDTIRQHREFLTHTGEIGGKRLSVIGTGIGPDNIDILLNEIDAVKNIDFDSREISNEFIPLSIIRMGTSGSIQEDIPVDSFIASSHGFGLDGLLNFYDYPKSAYQQAFLDALRAEIPLLFDICSPTFFEADKTLKELLAYDLHSGVTITAGGFYAPQGRELRLAQKMRPLIDELKKFNHGGLRFTNFEMETSSIYGLASLLRHKALSVNAIIANRANKTFSKDSQVTIRKMIQTMLERIVEKL